MLGGGVTPILLRQVTQKINILLKLCDPCLVTFSNTWKINNVVYHFDFPKRIKFDNVLCNKDLSYEPELFPAALISKWQPAHITLFPNGRGLITGIKLLSEAEAILDELPTFLAHNVNLH